MRKNTIGTLFGFINTLQTEQWAKTKKAVLVFQIVARVKLTTPVLKIFVAILFHLLSIWLHRMEIRGRTWWLRTFLDLIGPLGP